MSNQPSRESARTETGKVNAFPPAPSNRFLASMRLVGIAAWTLLIFPFFLLGQTLRGETPRRYPNSTWWSQFWLGPCRRMLGVRVHVEGSPPPEGCLLASNHTGYLDIIVLASLLRCFFVGKAEIATWPFMGVLYRKTDQIIVSRKRGRDLVETISRVSERLNAGQSVCVFLEGTSTGNDLLLPFYAPLVQPALDSGALVAPIGIRWRPRNPRLRVAEDIAYWGGHHMGHHAWRLLGLRGLDVHVRYGEPVSPEGHSRKSLAAELERRIAELTDLPLNRDGHHLY